MYSGYFFPHLLLARGIIVICPIYVSCKLQPMLSNDLLYTMAPFKIAVGPPKTKFPAPHCVYSLAQMNPNCSLNSNLALSVLKHPVKQNNSRSHIGLETGTTDISVYQSPHGPYRLLVVYQKSAFSCKMLDRYILYIM